jgi:hypothetical protein
MFWLVAALVVVALAAVVWWSSGRAKPGRDIGRDVEVGGAEGKSRSQITGANSSGPRQL